MKTLLFLGLGMLILVNASVAFAGEDYNTGYVLSVGKVNGTVCVIRVEGADFPNSCPGAGSPKEVYFTCDSNTGQDFLNIGVAAFMGSKPVRIVSDACSQYGSSVANLTSIYLDQQ